MKKYLYLIKISFQDLFEYRLNLFWRLGGTVIASFIIIAFWLTVIESNKDFSTYSSHDFIRYYIYMGFIMNFNLFPLWDLTASIREGDIVNQILKPLNHMLFWFVKTIPTKCIVALGYFIIGTILFYLDVLIFPSAENVFTFILSLFFGTLGNFLLNYLIGIFAIWLQRVNGIRSFKNTLQGILAGRYIPMSYLPSFLQNIARLFPFKYFTYLPVQIILNEITKKETIKSLFVSIMWVFVLLLAVQITWKRGLRSLDVVGI